jgi:hypothetical protein
MAVLRGFLEFIKEMDRSFRSQVYAFFEDENKRDERDID